MVSVPSIAAVSYLNTIPFIYGIRHEGNFRADLLLSPPSECTKNYVEERADLALLPAAAVPSLKSTEVITEYCIGAVGPVRTVVLLSDGPVSEVRRVFLDPHSQTSVQLVGYLAAHRWKIAPEWYSLDDYEQLRHAQEGDAFLLIGDKVFDHEEKFRYKIRFGCRMAGRDQTALCLCRLGGSQGNALRSHRIAAACPHVRFGTYLRSDPRSGIRQKAVRCL